MLSLGLGIWASSLNQTSANPYLARFVSSGAGNLFTDTAGTIAASSNGDAIAKWKDLGSLGANLTQSTSSNRPTLTSATPCVTFDGTDDRLISSTAISAVSGSLVVVFTTGATAFATRGAQVLVSGADATAANKWFEIGIESDGRVYIEYNNAGTKNTVACPSYLDVSTSYALLVVFDGTDYYAILGTTEQNPMIITSVGAFGWFGSVSGANNFVLGGTVTSAGLVRPFQGSILEAAIYASDIT